MVIFSDSIFLYSSFSRPLCALCPLPLSAIGLAASDRVEARRRWPFQTPRSARAPTGQPRLRCDLDALPSVGLFDAVLPLFDFVHRSIFFFIMFQVAEKLPWNDYIFISNWEFAMVSIS